MPPKKAAPTSFPLLKLPQLGRDQVLKSLPVADLLSFSATTPKGKSRVRRCKIVTYHCFVYTHLIHFSFTHDTAGRLEWKFVQSNEAPEDQSVEDMIKTAEKEGIKYRTACRDIDKAVGAVLAYLDDLFKLEISCFSFELTENGRGIKEKLDILNVTKAKQMDVYMSKRFETSDLRYLIDHVQVSDRLHIKSAKDGYFEFSDPFLIAQLDVRDARWFSRSNLLATNCTRLTLSRCFLKCEDINEYIRQWQKGSFPNLQVLEWVSSTQALDDGPPKRALMAGLQPKRFDQQHAREYNLDMFYFFAGLRICTHCVNIKLGCDIVRDHDNAVATIATYHCELLFIVWGSWIPDKLKKPHRRN